MGKISNLLTKASKGSGKALAEMAIISAGTFFGTALGKEFSTHSDSENKVGPVIMTDIEVARIVGKVLDNLVSGTEIYSTELTSLKKDLCIFIEEEINNEAEHTISILSDLMMRGGWNLEFNSEQLVLDIIQKGRLSLSLLNPMVEKIIAESFDYDGIKVNNTGHLSLTLVGVASIPVCFYSLIESLFELIRDNLWENMVELPILEHFLKSDGTSDKHRKSINILLELTKYKAIESIKLKLNDKLAFLVKEIGGEVRRITNDKVLMKGYIENLSKISC